MHIDDSSRHAGVFEVHILRLYFERSRGATGAIQHSLCAVRRPAI